MILKDGLLTDDITRWKDAFIAEKVSLGKSINTIEQYSRIIDRFIEYSLTNEDELDISNLNHEYISYFLLWKDNESLKGKISINTRNLYITVLKNFYLYISQHNDELIDLTRNLNRLQLSKETKEKEYYTKEEIVLINDYIDDILLKKPNFLKVRNGLVLKLFLFAGLRVMEIQELKLDDITVLNEDGKKLVSVLVNGKGNKQRVIYIAYDKIYIVLNLYKELLFKQQHIMSITKTLNYIAISSKLKRMSRAQIESSIKNILKKTKVIKVLHLHALRRSFANMVNKLPLSTLKDIQVLLGHENINTTAIYLNSTDSDKKKIALSL